MVLTFSDIDDDISKLIDDIASSSEQALEELEQIAEIRPAIVFEEFSDDTIGKATLDSLRMKEIKDFLFDTDNFEKNLLISQLKVLRVISHLAIQLEQKETNNKRKIWLNKLAVRYENYYQKVNKRISVSVKTKT